MLADQGSGRELPVPEATYRLALLGAPGLRIGSTSCVLQRMGYVLLAALALAKGPVPRRSLAAMFWPEADVTVALARLRRLVYRVEQAVPGAAIAVDGDGLSLGSAQWDADVRAGARFIQRGHDWSQDATHETARTWVDRLGMPLLDGIETGPQGLHAYFVHSYALAAERPQDVLALTEHGGPVTAMVAHGNVAGTQFHPEKSQKLGLKLITNFLSWAP